MQTRPITPSDFADVLALNEESVHFLSPLSASLLERLHAQAAFHGVLEKEGRIVAFVLTFEEGADYDSVNYQWFFQRYPRFLYVDRVVVAQGLQSAGAGSALYKAVFNHAVDNDIPIVACEYDVEPLNPVSQRFHEKFGFAEVGQQAVADGKKIVSLQIARAAPVFELSFE